MRLGLAWWRQYSRTSLDWKLGDLKLVGSELVPELSSIVGIKGQIN